MLLEWLTKTIRNHKTALGGLVLMLALLFALCWTGYDLHHAVKGQCEYQIIHDGYTEKQVLYPQDPAAGLIQTLPQPEGQSVYGMRLMFATDGRVAHGSYTVRLMRDGQMAAGSTRDMTELLDGAFVDVLFDGPAVLEPGHDYQLEISFAPETEQDRAGLVYGDGKMASAQMQLYAAGQTASAGRTTPLQYITNYTGNGFGLRLFAPLALVLLLTLMLGWLLIFVKKAKLPVLFVVLAAGLSFVWAVVTPPLAGPDEYVHTAAAYRITSRILGQPESEKGLMMRTCDAPYMLDHSGPIGPIAYKNMADGLFVHGQSGELTETVAVRAPGNVQPVQYLPQVIGILLARLTGLGFYPMLLLSRLLSAAAFIALAALSIHITPVGKKIFFTAGLLPASLSLSATLSADPPVIGMAFLFTALCLAGRYGEQPFGIGKQLVLVLLAALLGPAKAVYLPLVLLCFMIPKQKLGSRAQLWLVRGGVPAAALIGWIAANGKAIHSQFRSMDLERMQSAGILLAVLGLLAWLGWKRWGSRPSFKKALTIGVVLLVLAVGAAGLWVMANSGVHLTAEEYAAGIQPNGESVYLFSVGYILSHLPQTFKLIVNTLRSQLPVYLQGMMGSLPGEPIVYQLELNWTITILLMLLVLAVSIRTEQQPRRLDRPARRGIAAAAAAVVLLIVAACLSWTPINYTVIFGIQGRYLLPILPVLMLLLGEQQTLVFRKDRSSALLLSAGLLNAVSALGSLLLFASA